jgi:surface protein
MSTTKKIKIVLTKAGTAYDETKEYHLHDYIIIDNSVMYICRRVDATTMVCVGHPLTDEQWWDKSIDLSEWEGKADAAVTKVNSVIASAEEAASSANKAATNANDATTKATAAVTSANTALANANTALANSEKINVTLSSDNVFSVTDKTGTTKTLSLATTAEVSDIVSHLNEYHKPYFDVVMKADDYVYVDGVGTLVPARKRMRFYPTSSNWRLRQYSWETNKNVIFFKSYNGVIPGGSSLKGCSSASYIDVSGFDTSNATYLGELFRDCTSLTTLDVSNFDTSKVTSLHCMFYNCTYLTSLDVSGFDTSNIVSFQEMFGLCTHLTSLRVLGWNTSSATNMRGMFRGCTSLTTLDVSNFDTSKVTNMYIMFSGCTSLTNLLFGSKWGTQTSTAAEALTLDLSTLGSSKSYKLTDATYNSMLTMYDRASAGLATMTIKFSSKHNLPDGFAEKMSALGYTITLV